jgi:hypothetical protein
MRHAGAPAKSPAITETGLIPHPSGLPKTQKADIDYLFIIIYIIYGSHIVWDAMGGIPDWRWLGRVRDGDRSPRSD